MTDTINIIQKVFLRYKSASRKICVNMRSSPYFVKSYLDPADCRLTIRVSLQKVKDRDNFGTYIVVIDTYSDYVDKE